MSLPLLLNPEVLFGDEEVAFAVLGDQKCPELSSTAEIKIAAGNLVGGVGLEPTASPVFYRGALPTELSASA